MKKTLKKISLAITGAGMLTLYGCGGGGSVSGVTTSEITTPTTLTGVAATGAAFDGAIVTVTDSRGVVVGTSGVVGADGTYSITLSAGAVAPLVLSASRTTADGEVESMVSIIPSSSTTAATVNITPVTNLIASRLSNSGDPTKLAAELAAGTSIVSAATVAARVLEIQTILAPMLTATGTTATDPLGGTFTTNGTGYDRLLDSIKVTITPFSATATNVEIGIKQQLAEGVAPTAIQFTNGAGQTLAASVPAIPSITASTLVPSGTAALIASHLAQLTSCYAVPFATRVSGTISGTAPNQRSVGTATNVIAQACRDAFMGNDPANFKSNGSLVGRDANGNGAFSGLFKEGATGVVFNQGTYEFTRANGDIVVGYKSKDAAGNELFDTFALRLDTDGKLKQIGNQYNYSGGVSSYQQLRQFPTLSQSAFNYYSTGYNLNVSHITGGSGVDGSIFDRVEVTTPRGNVLTLKPKAGLSSLSLVKFPGGVGGTEVVTGTSFLRLNSEYSDTANSADPKLKDTSLFFADRTVFTNAVIAQISAQSVWKFDYYLAGNTGSTPDATQHYKTRARALTIPELKTKGLATLSDADITYVQTNANAANITNPGKLPMSGFSSTSVNYTVPTGALPPTSLKVFGGYTNGNFDDSVGVASTARTGNILCTKTGVSDTHCSGASGTPYAASAVGTGIHLWSRDTAGREFANFYAWYKLAP